VNLKNLLCRGGFETRPYWIPPDYSGRMTIRITGQRVIYTLAKVFFTSPVLIHKKVKEVEGKSRVLGRQRNKFIIPLSGIIFFVFFAIFVVYESYSVFYYCKSI